MAPPGLAARYRHLALRQVPRILGLADREAGSETYGCFDRAYWHYRLIDFPNMQQQQAALLLLLLRDTPGRYQGLPVISEWAQAALEFWASRQHPDGSFDEAYPNERGYCVTALTAASAGSALLLEPALRGPQLLETLTRALTWLDEAPRPPVANQLAAAALARQAARSLGLSPALGTELDELLASQDEHGFFPEYGGPDVGYQSLTLAFLARLRRLAQAPDRPRLDHALLRGAAALTSRLDALGRHDPSQNSRGTQYLYPSGLVAVKAEPALRAHAQGLEQEAVLEPGWLDDRYVIWLTTDYLLAAQVLDEESPWPNA